MSDKGGYSREGLFGDIIHYDSEGHKIGESRPGFLGGYTNYDAKGHKIGSSEEQIFGVGYNHYDNSGHKIGSSSESFFGGYDNYDAAGRRTGHTERSIFDVDEDTLRRTGSMYHKHYDPPRGSSYPSGGGTNGGQRDRADLHFSSAGAWGIVLAGLVIALLAYQAVGESISVGLLAVIWIGSSIGILLLIAGFRSIIHETPTDSGAGAGRTTRDERTAAGSAAASEETAAPEDGGSNDAVRYIIARSSAHGRELCYRTTEAFSVGDTAVDTMTGERLDVCAVVDCLEDALPPETKREGIVIREGR